MGDVAKAPALTGVLSAGDAKAARPSPHLTPVEPTSWRGVGGGIVTIVALVVGTFLWSARDKAVPNAPSTPQKVAVRTAPKKVTPQTGVRRNTSRSRSRSRSKVDAKGRPVMTRMANVARHRNRKPYWTAERLAKLKEKNPKDVFFGNEPAPPREYQRPYDNEKVENPQPMLTVASQPPGMNVYVDGKLVGRTPYLRAMPRDALRVEVKISGGGFIPETSVVRQDQDGHYRYNVVMTPDPQAAQK